ncbi:ComEC/Rec2 family competence protein [Bacillus sp. FJAT-45037]|uniref:ComEC/Rec2 family competence protein n=1 Tax=Bacillus sp. FJAT-45037 TaxID=2011007 RepID=UPI000C23259B|nr:hypothetical protein [Bacillus sp. FJAT-45037]
MRVHRWIVLCMFVVFLIRPQEITAQSNFGLEKMVREETEEVAALFLDLPEGEATLLHTPDDFNVLIGSGSESSFDDLILRLECLNIKNIDQFILPNLDQTYIGSAEKIIDQFKVSQLIVPTEGLNWTKETFSDAPVEIISWLVGNTYGVHPDLRFSIYESGNSIVSALNMDVEFGQSMRIFFANEASEKLEERWMEHDLQTVNVLKVAEYGKGQGTGEAFLEALDPEVAIIYNLQDHRVSQGVLERLQETWIDTYETKQHGTILIKAEKTDYKLMTIRF